MASLPPQKVNDLVPCVCTRCGNMYRPERRWGKAVAIVAMALVLVFIPLLWPWISPAIEANTTSSVLRAQEMSGWWRAIWSAFAIAFLLRVHTGQAATIAPCPHCNAEAPVPLTSPAGRKLMLAHGEAPAP